MRIWIMSLLLAWAGGAAASQVSYDLSIRGITVGRLVLAAEENATRYSVAARITNTGLTRVIRRFSYQGQAQGRIVQGALRPELYTERADTGKRSSEVEIRYRGGVPDVVRYTSPKAAGADAPSPESQGGTVDPLTGVYALLRDVPAAEACRLNALLFDGRRQSRIAMQLARTEEGLPVCTGRYERLRGFTAEEVARHAAFDFTLFYQAGPGARLSVREVVFQSLYGQSVIRRR